MAASFLLLLFKAFGWFVILSKKGFYRKSTYNSFFKVFICFALGPAGWVVGEEILLILFFWRETQSNFSHTLYQTSKVPSQIQHPQFHFMIISSSSFFRVNQRLLSQPSIQFIFHAFSHFKHHHIFSPFLPGLNVVKSQKFSYPIYVCLLCLRNLSTGTQRILKVSRLKFHMNISTPSICKSLLEAITNIELNHIRFNFGK